MTTPRHASLDAWTPLPLVVLLVFHLLSLIVFRVFVLPFNPLTMAWLILAIFWIARGSALARWLTLAALGTLGAMCPAMVAHERFFSGTLPQHASSTYLLHAGSQAAAITAYVVVWVWRHGDLGNVGRDS